MSLTGVDQRALESPGATKKTILFDEQSHSISKTGAAHANAGYQMSFNQRRSLSATRVGASNGGEFTLFDEQSHSNPGKRSIYEGTLRDCLRNPGFLMTVVAGAD